MRKGLLIAGMAMAVVLSGLGWSAGPAAAAPADGAWEFTGSLSAPARSLTDVTVTVSGSLEVTAGLLSLVSQTDSCDDTNPAQVIPALQHTSTQAITAITNGGLVLTPITAPGTSSVSGTATVAPGSYNLILRFRCASAGTWHGNVLPTPPVSVSIASLVSTTLSTKACLTTTPVSACGSLSQAATSVPQGLSVTFGGVVRRTWSDGATTEAAVDGSQSLKRAEVGGGSWSTISSSCAYTTNVTSTYQYRCESDYGVHDVVTVTSMPPTTDFFIGAPAVSPTFAVRGTVVTISGIIQMRYPDNSQWPAPVGSAYTVQFQAEGSTTWTTVTAATVAVYGNFSTTFALPGTGKVRVSAGASSSSTEVAIRELKSTGTYRISALSAPATVSPRTAMTVSAGVQTLWSDDSYRDAPDGTATTLQFAESFQSTATPQTWTTVRTGTTSGGRATFSVTPQASGFWRILVEGQASSTAYVTVTGSAPLTLSATLTPSPGSAPPFVEKFTTYDVTASVGGYVGSDPLILFVALDGVSFDRFGSVTAGAVSGTMRIQAPSKPGNYTPAWQLRRTNGDVLATAASTPIFVDGIKGYEITAEGSSDSIREGQNARITATVAVVTYTGQRSRVTWSGAVALQRDLGRGWSTIDTKSRTSGTRVEFTTPAVDKAAYRVVWSARDATSNAVRIEVSTPTTEIRFGRVAADDVRIIKGDSVRLTASVQVKYTDGEFYAAPAGEQVLLQVSGESGWKTVRTLFARGGSVASTVKPSATTSYRFALSGTTVSKTLTVSVTEAKPVKIRIDWPETFYYSEGGTFTGYIETNAGTVWRGTTQLLLQYRYAGESAWRKLDEGTYKGQRFQWGWGPGPVVAVTFRVYAPALGLDNTTKYWPDY